VGKEPRTFPSALGLNWQARPKSVRRLSCAPPNPIPSALQIDVASPKYLLDKGGSR
jgi:hypothetical protein